MTLDLGNSSQPRRQAHSAKEKDDMTQGQMAAHGEELGPQALRKSVRMKRPSWRVARRD